jgi:hypothetical protein
VPLAVTAINKTSCASTTRDRSAHLRRIARQPVLPPPTSPVPEARSRLRATLMPVLTAGVRLTTAMRRGDAITSLYDSMVVNHRACTAATSMASPNPTRRAGCYPHRRPVRKRCSSCAMWRLSDSCQAGRWASARSDHCVPARPRGPLMAVAAADGADAAGRGGRWSQ